MKHFIRAAAALCVLLLSAFALAEAPAANLTGLKLPKKAETLRSLPQTQSFNAC